MPVRSPKTRRHSPVTWAQRERRRRWRRAAPILAAIVVAAAAVAVTVRLLGGSSGRCQQSFVPAFFAPGSGWSQAISATPPPGVMILDISGTGAGSAPNPAFQAVVRQAQAAGVTVLGYSGTDYTGRPVAAVEADVRHYRSWYGVTGIFLDQSASGAGQLGYYRQLAAYIRRLSPGSRIWLNPGTYPAESYMSIANVIMVYEGTYADYRHIGVPAWTARYPADRFAHTIYATPAGELDHAINLARARHAGYVYVTSGSGANPYSALPAYWAAEDTALGAKC
ncbi:MAG: spherulation-specific family 4 protein [Streptosporangiaceae bacterium]|jgi:hypothetical protein